MNSISIPTVDLAEGPVWLKDADTLCFVDINGGRVFALRDGAVRVYEMNGRTGFVVPCGAHGLVAGVDRSLMLLDLDSGGLTTLSQYPYPEFLRFNDGKCDAEGRLWAGMMAWDRSHERAGDEGLLLRIEKNRADCVKTRMSIPNGMDWDEDRGWFYHTDTATGKISRRRWPEESPWETALDLRGEQGVPDGFCIDAEGMLWVAMWGGYQVLRCDPVAGCVLERFPVPDRNVSCCAFGGHALNRLFVTTARDNEGKGGGLYEMIVPQTGKQPYAYQLPEKDEMHER